MDSYIHTHSFTLTHKYTYIFGMATKKNDKTKGTHENNQKVMDRLAQALNGISSR